MTQPVTADDVTVAIASQHARITLLLDHLDTCPVEGQSGALHELLAYLAGHEAVEEELIHPLIPRAGGHDQGLERELEEAGMSEQVLRLEQLAKGTQSFSVQLSLLADSFKHHARAEEHDELPRLARSLTSEQASLIVDALNAHAASASRREGSFAAMLVEARAEVRALVGERRPAHH